jgi:DNA-binding MarR family transcriptional regulator
MSDADGTRGRIWARLPSGSVGQFLASIGNLSTCLGAIHAGFSQQHDLGPRGIWMLSWISEGHGHPGYIAKAMKLPPSVVSGDLRRLVEAGLSVSARSGEDGRRLCYTLTPAGAALLSQAHALYVEALGEKVASYPAEDMRTTLRILYELSQHVRGIVGPD